MIGPLLALAWAAPPPDLDLQDLERPSRAVAAALAGPQGCWDAHGDRTWAWWERSGGHADGESSTAAQIASGTWRGTEAWEGFQSVVGTVPGADRRAESVLSWLGGLHGEIETSWLRWDDDRGLLVLEETVALREPESEVTRRAWLDGDQVLWVEATYPSVPLGDGSRLIGAGWEVRFGQVNGVTVPVEEFVVVRIRTRTRLVRGHQELRWSGWTPCGNTN